MQTEDLISQLSSGLQPVRRVPSPWRLAFGWLGLALLVVGGAVAFFGLRQDWYARAHIAYEVEQWVASVAAGVLGALAAAMLAQPDRSWRWVLLPVPALLAWMLALLLGVDADLARQAQAHAHASDGLPCVSLILTLGLPLLLVQFWVLRHAGPTRPLPVQVTGALASAALCSAGVSLIHPLDAAQMVLFWHGLALGLMVLLGWLVGRVVLLRPVTLPR